MTHPQQDNGRLTHLLFNESFKETMRDRAFQLDFLRTFTKRTDIEEVLIYVLMRPLSAAEKKEFANGTEPVKTLSEGALHFTCRLTSGDLVMFKIPM